MHLRAFVTVVETGSVTRAATLINLVQPAVSRQLRLLEEYMGVELFDRSHHGMQITAHGKTMLEYARRILGEVERAKAEIQPTDGPVAGIVSIGLLASTSDLLATQLTANVAERFPHIRLRLTIGYARHLQVWLEAGDVDAALLYDQKETPALHVKPILEESLWVRALVHWGEGRLATLPSVPSFKELGLQVQYSQWAGMFVPAHTPFTVVDTLRQAARFAAQDPRALSALTAAGSSFQYQDAPDFDRFVQADARSMAALVLRIGKVD